ncbi:ABC transporter permease subunit [Planomicrobium okeanokoites]|uniref:ABC transporter permease subunit n=1 Tax=Planomicrobium okeanokoites TaxID=244 RepID=A0ABV7KS84_PLAOK|nr:ABC transporter permease subunit [Planomicrobium okeanokoites]TAA70161.1 ABC transporter permease subunit [Planomicrobium okeanokoites]
MAASFDIFLRFFYVALGLIFLSAFVGLFTDGFHLDIGLFVSNVIGILESFVSPDELSIIGPNGKEYTIFLQFWDHYFYSLMIFLSAFLLALGAGILLAYITAFLPENRFNSVSKTVSLLEALPDLFIIIVIQFAVLFYFKQTGTLLFPVASTGQNKSYMLPVLALALIPSLMVYKVILFLVKDELEKPYVNLAKGKGISKSMLFFRHILRNIIPSIFSHSKSILLLLLSSMVIFEQIFNINGIFTFIITYPEPNVIAFTLILFYLPIFLLYALVTLLIGKTTGQRLEW